MKVTILSGSPKGKTSVTYQSARYLEAKYSEDTFFIHQIGQRIKYIESHKEELEKIIEDVKKSDVVIWLYPVYTFLVPYQMMRFNELIIENNYESAFEGKYASQLSTSKHFYDVTAGEYIHEVAEDFKMKYLFGHFADMEDILSKKGQRQLEEFWDDVRDRVLNKRAVTPKFIFDESSASINIGAAKLKNRSVTYNYSSDKNKKANIENNHIITLITDIDHVNEKSNLANMINSFIDKTPNEVRVVKIDKKLISGGCLGCFKCSFDGKCIYKDDFCSVHYKLMTESDVLIYAGEINHHFFNSIWKGYDDRMFYNGHRTSMHGKAIGYLVSGKLRKESNFRTVLEARAQVGGLYLIDIVTDEFDDDTINSHLESMAGRMINAANNKYNRPANFYGVGGMKIFRDLIYVMRGLMQEDHKFYKKNGHYDFPQKEKKKIIQMQLIGMLLKSKKGREMAGAKMDEAIIAPYNKLIETIKLK